MATQGADPGTVPSGEMKREVLALARRDEASYEPAVATA
jgi:hypothetical protein